MHVFENNWSANLCVEKSMRKKSKEQILMDIFMERKRRRRYWWMASPPVKSDFSFSELSDFEFWFRFPSWLPNIFSFFVIAIIEGTKGDLNRLLFCGARSELCPFHLFKSVMNSYFMRVVIAALNKWIPNCYVYLLLFLLLLESFYNCLLLFFSMTS
jgi:hypothetical protein